MMRVVIKNIIEKMPGFEVVANAANGKLALVELQKRSDLSLILLDIEMPEMNGLEFLRHAKLRTRAKIASCPRSPRPARHTPPKPANWGPTPL